MPSSRGATSTTGGKARGATTKRRPRVAETLLFRLSAAVQVPLLVTRVDGDTVWGHVFTEPESHSGEGWIVDYLFWRPSREQPTFLVEAIQRGRGVGHWEYADAGHD